MAKRPAKRKWLIPSAIILGLIVLLVALLPMMISAGLGHGMIRGAIESQINGTASFQQLRVRWFGPQTINGLRLVDTAGREAALVDLSVQQGLFPLIFSNRTIDLTVAGTVRSQWHEDGSFSLAQLVPKQPDDDPDEPLSLEGVPSIAVTVAGLTAFVHDVAANQEFALEDLSGYFVYLPGSDLRFELQGVTDSAGRRGTLAASGASPTLFDRAGRMTPEGAAMDVQLAITSIAVPGVDVPSVLNDFTLQVQSQNVAQLVSLSMQGQGTIQDEPPSRFHGEFRVRNPIKQDGTIDFDLNRVAGEMTGERVPSSLLQPAFNDTPVVLSRDVGRTVDVDLQLNAEDDGVITIRAVGSRATVELAALDRDGWWLGDHLMLRTAAAHPDLVAGFTGLTIEQATDVEIHLTAFSVPPVDERLNGRPWGLAGATGVLRVNGPTSIILMLADADDENETAAEPLRFALSNATLNIDSSQLGDALYLAGSLSLDGGDVTIDHTITGLADEFGRIDFTNAQPVGTLIVSNVPTATVRQVMPEQAELLDELLGQSVNASLQTQLAAEGLQARLTADGRNVQTNVSAVRGDAALRLLDGSVQLNLSPAMVQTFLTEMMDEPVQLTQSMTATVELAPAEFPGSPPFDYQWRGVPITGILTTSNFSMSNVPGAAEVVGVHNVRATIDAQLDEQWSYGINGEARVARVSPNRRVANLAYNITAAPRADETMALNGSVTMSRVVVAHAEGLLGFEPGGFSNWVGESGSLRTDFQTIEDRYEATLNSELERLVGTFLATLAGDLLTISTDTADINIAATALESMLAGEGEPDMIDVLSDVPFRLVMRSQMPLSLFTEEPYDPNLVDVSAELTGGPLLMVSEGRQSTLSNVVIAMRSEVVGDGVDFLFSIDSGISETPASAQTGEIEVQARVSDLIMPGSPFDMGTASINADASVVRAPTILADGLFNMHGYLVAAIGPEINATVVTRNFSRDSGSMSMDVSAENGWLRAAGEGSEGLLWFVEGSPLEGELQLTPLLRDGLLANVHPLLRDVVSLAQPLHVTLSNARLPLDGDISRLNGDLLITLGQVEFNPRSPMFAMLRAARVTDATRLSGSIDPIHARIRDGVISYDQFVVSIHEIRMPYQGQINLAARSIDLRTTLPLGELLVTGISEVPEEARMINVPLVTRGSFDSFETQIDPQFDLSRALIEAGVRRGLDELIPRDRLPFDFRDIFPRR